MTNLAQSPKITPAHLSRKAIVYLRQSSERQVHENTESQRLQYALADRARALGWDRVEIIDSDLGRSAAIGAARREGFERLIASVALGEVGLVLSREVSRLSRTDKDWCHLCEVCQIFGTLIGDADQLYDLELMDDQLVLGIKATLERRRTQGAQAAPAAGDGGEGPARGVEAAPAGGLRAGWNGPGGEGSRPAGPGGARAGLPEVPRIPPAAARRSCGFAPTGSSYQ